MSAAIETAILAQLRAKLDASIHVAAASDVAATAVSAQVTPAVYLGYAGDETLNSTTDGSSVQEQTYWGVMIVTRSARQGEGGKETRHHALDIRRAVFSALSGFIPIENGRRLIMVSPRGEPEYASGFYWLPMLFTHQTFLTKELP